MQYLLPKSNLRRRREDESIRSCEVLSGISSTYFKTYYSPDNCVAVIVGDVTVSEVESLAKIYFEPIPTGPLPREIKTVEPEQDGEKRLNIKRDLNPKQENDTKAQWV